MEQTDIVRIFHDYTALPIPLHRIVKQVRTIAETEKIRRTRCIDVIFCSDYRIKKLNNEYLGINRVTDVIAFPFEDQDLLGEVYVSLNRAAAQARRFGRSYDDEVVLLVTHGMLHLVGYDDLDEKACRAMIAREEFYGCRR